MEQKEFTFPSADGKTVIHAGEYLPDPSASPKGVVQIEHGLSENSRIYRETAEALAARGWLVRVHDHIGHGASLGEGQKRNHFGEKGSWEYALKDMRTLRTQPLPEGFERLPYVLLGHSLGSFLVRDYLLHWKDVSGAVVSGSGVQSAYALKLVAAVVRAETKNKGYASDSDMVQGILHGSNNKKLGEGAGSAGWLVKEPAARNAFETDSDLGGRITAGIFLELTDAMLRTQNQKLLRTMDPEIPMLFLAGGEDASLNFGKAMNTAADLYSCSGMKRVERHLYPNSRHCIFQDVEKDRVLHDVLAWLDTLN